MFIIGEASMVPIHALAAIDKMLQDITATEVPIGGKIFLMGGDFCQVLPVVPRSPRTVITENCIKSSPLWPYFQIYRLKINLGAHQDQQHFAKWRLALGSGDLHCEQPPPVEGSIPIPADCNISHGDIIDEVFPDVSDPKFLASTVILTLKNYTSLAINA